MYIGYGIDTSSDNFKLKENAAEKLWKKVKDIDLLMDDYEEYCAANDLDSKESESFEIYVENYEDEDSLFAGFEALLVAVINEEIDPPTRPFTYDDYCIVVPAGIPADDKEKAAMLTQQRIREILAEYVNPLIEEPVVITWLNISDN